MDAIHSKLEEIAAACRAHDVARLELFGSRARADFRADSDFDFVVEFRDPLRAAFDRYFDLHDALEAILGVRVDLMVGAAIRNSVLRRRVAQDKRLIYAA